jgi:N-acetylmuramic acid 6-phosphate (MurNAc-6-P) etherase
MVVLLAMKSIGIDTLISSCVVGPEFVTGSSRMKTGTAQKLVLNMISNYNNDSSWLESKRQ